MLKRNFSGLLLSCLLTSTAFAITPSGGWTLANESKNVRDYAMRIDVDPGEAYASPGYAPSSVYWAQYIHFNRQPGYGGYLGLQRYDGRKIAIVSIWDGSSAKSGILPAVDCYEFGPCTSIKGPYDWKVGHKYRFRVELSPRTPSDTAGDWWQITLADLTTGKIDILGELKTPKWDGLSRENGVFLEYFQGPFGCNNLRHAKATEAQAKGDFGRDTILASSNGNSYGDPDVCDAQFILPGMTSKQYGSSSWDRNDTLTLLGNNYRGLHRWGEYEHNANKGMMFVEDLESAEPYIFEARHDGKYGPFPSQGADNEDWKSIGAGYPIINDLYFRNQRVYEWEERNAPYVKIGDYFRYENPYNKDTEFFKLKKSNAFDFPTDKTDNEFWTYVGRYSKPNEALSPELPIHHWDDSNRRGQKGWLYYADGAKMYFILKTNEPYWYFPTKAEDNQWWQFAGYHR